MMTQIDNTIHIHYLKIHNDHTKRLEQNQRTQERDFILR